MTGRFGEDKCLFFIRRPFLRISNSGGICCTISHFSPPLTHLFISTSKFFQPKQGKLRPCSRGVLPYQQPAFYQQTKALSFSSVSAKLFLYTGFEGFTLHYCSIGIWIVMMTIPSSAVILRFLQMFKYPAFIGAR